MSPLSADLMSLASLCTPAWTSDIGALGLYTGLFLAGLTGSLMHCGPMCGGFVMAQVGRRMALAPAGGLCERARLAQSALPSYHLGRISTYALLGMLAGGLGAAFATLPLFRWAVAILLLMAAMMLALLALTPITGPRFTRSGLKSTSAVHRMIGPLRGFFDRPIGWRGYGLGMMLGFLPCGLIYSALVVAAATGKPLAGALALTSFGLGTAPALIALGVLGQLAGRRWQALGQKAAPVLLGLNALLLSALAWKAVL
ncbi:MAG: sulfite exporter TauE/SafE family protein [Elstera sp.]